MTAAAIVVPVALFDQLRTLESGRIGDPFQLLGPQVDGDEVSLRVWRPGATAVRLDAEDGPELQRAGGSGLFVWPGKAAQLRAGYRVFCTYGDGHWHSSLDAYAFRGPLIADFDLHLFGEGRHWHAQEFLGAHVMEVDGVAGVRFAVWAPHAVQVSVVGDFNGWNGRLLPMRGHASGVWQLFVPEVAAGAFYKFEVHTANGARLLKSDPYARSGELRPNTASVITAPSAHAWGDAQWLQSRTARDPLHAPLSVYEVHLGSWQRGDDNGFLNYRELAHRLVPYAVRLGFTHVELLPVAEHPFDGSWGYQVIGLFAPTKRHGSPDDFRYFVDYAHQHGLGVIMDWVPAHFPKDAHGLARFDGQPLYEYPDPQRGEHPDWGTLVYDYGRPQVRSFLLANALYWIEEFHVDALRVDAVASMTHLDYSRRPGQWKPNKFGGNAHLEAVEFLQQLNTVVHGQHPGTMVIAEESTAWPGVSRPVDAGGLGFTMKWDMGWMHDTIDYFAKDPVYRRHHNAKITFGMSYFYNENFVNALSHDEVVHGKRPMIFKMPGDRWQQFANLRLLYAWMYLRPGKKLLFMGCEFAQEREWSEARPLDWAIDTQPLNAGLRGWLTDLNRLHTQVPAFHELDFDPAGFEWIDCNNAAQSVFVFRRRDRFGNESVVVLNCTPVPREGYRIGVPVAGRWLEVLNSDAAVYGGSGVGMGGAGESQAVACMGLPQSLVIRLPPLGALVLQPQP